jgi:hypothetical protein
MKVCIGSAGRHSCQRSIIMDQNIGAVHFWRTYREHVCVQTRGGLRCGLVCSHVRHRKIVTLYPDVCDHNVALTIVGSGCLAQGHRLVEQTSYTNNQNKCRPIRTNGRCRCSQPNGCVARETFKTHCARARCHAQMWAHDVDIAATCCQAMCATNRAAGQPQTHHQMLVKQASAPKCFVCDVLRDVFTFGDATPETVVPRRASNTTSIAMITPELVIRRVGQPSRQPMLKE